MLTQTTNGLLHRGNRWFSLMQPTLADDFALSRADLILD